jgi:hypothetical protein
MAFIELNSLDGYLLNSMAKTLPRYQLIVDLVLASQKLLIG